jgi:hypothetical protein
VNASQYHVIQQTQTIFSPLSRTPREGCDHHSTSPRHHRIHLPNPSLRVCGFGGRTSGRHITRGVRSHCTKGVGLGCLKRAVVCLYFVAHGILAITIHFPMLSYSLFRQLIYCLNNKRRKINCQSCCQFISCEVVSKMSEYTV